MFLLDLLLPKFCLGCGFLGAYICHNCREKLSYIQKDSCLYCGKASLYGLTHPACFRRYGIDGLMSIFHYNNLLKTIIKSIKYRLATEVWRELCLVIKPDRLIRIKIYQELFSGNLLLQPIPLHPHKLKQRGFNQAEIISLFFSSYLKLGLADCLKRHKDTPSQAQMKSNLERFVNIRNAFEFSGPDIRNNDFLLVDDVVTTGSTVKEAAGQLKKAGAKRVFVLTLARG